MGYVVFARKYRPRGFGDVVGQDHIVGTLRRAIETGKVAHAYLFIGTRGVGKTTTARILARALNCEKSQGPTVTPCGECASCESILNGSSFDVLEIDGASNRGIDDARALRESVNYSSMAGRYRVIIIDEVHMLTKDAFNALLKTFEEPPPNVIFILATTDPQKVLPTIQSRCQRHDFRRVSAEMLAAHIAKICDAEGVTYESGALTLIARKSDGSVRDSLTLLDQACSFCGGNLTESGVSEVLGLVGTDVFRGLMRNIREKNRAEALEAVGNTLHAGYDLNEFVTGLLTHLRNILFARVSGALESSGIGLSAEEAKGFAEEAEGFAEPDLMRMAEIVKRTEQELRRGAAYPRFLAEMMILKLLHLDNSVSIEQLLKFAASGAGAAAPPSPSGEDVKKKLN